MMKIGILGYGKEGQSAEKYFSEKGDVIEVFDNFTSEDLDHLNLDGFDLILRSPSVQPRAGWSSMTQYFFENCKCPIIGVTGTKGKGTTSSLITAVLEQIGRKVWLVGNIGNPALDVLDQILERDVVVFELSSFQLWDLPMSPHIAVVLGIEPDHLNIHRDFDDYVQAKANIVKYQTQDDFCIYYAPNSDSTKIAQQSPAKLTPYPVSERVDLDQVLAHLAIPGQHNRDNAEAALLAVASLLKLSLPELLVKYKAEIIRALENFQGLPHRLQFLREFDHVRYYDDNFSTTLTSLEVALKAFDGQPLVLILGGRDKTNGADFPKIVQLIQDQKVARVVLMGESGQELYKILQDVIPNQVVMASSLAEAVKLAATAAEALSTLPEDNEHFLPALTDDVRTSPVDVVVLMSPAAASFDMFENVYDRGAQFQKLIQELS